MANPAGTITTASGIAKKKFGDIQNMIPAKSLQLVNDAPYRQDAELGASYNELIWLTLEHGFTYGGSTGDELTLNPAEVAISKEASLTPSVIEFRSRAVITTMYRAEARGDKAYEAYVTALMRNARKSFDKRLEITCRRGGTYLAAVDSATDAGTTSVLTINPGTWAPFIWLGMENAPLDAYNGAAQLNTAAALYITVVNPKDKKITVTGNATDIDAIVAAGSAVQLYFRGAFGKEMTGLQQIASLNSGSGNYLGIACGAFASVWCATQVTWNYATTDFTWNLLNTGIEEAAGRGLNCDVKVDVPFPQWTKLNGSLDALRVFDTSFSVSRTELGREPDSITYRMVNGKKATIQPSGYAWAGEVLVYPDRRDDEAEDIFARIGSTNVTFQLNDKGEMFKYVEDKNSVEWRASSDQALWCPAPRNCIKFAA